MLVDKICKQGDIVLQEPIVRTSIDRGQGSIKVMNLLHSAKQQSRIN